jgi:4-amino-4-deoxy-L-arabinose transferase-like glycosyltransferase
MTAVARVSSPRERMWLVPAALCALGAALRLWQYGAAASLWADEANLALNIVERPLGRLLGPLDYRQVAPPLWLLLQKASVTLFGEGEYALRLVPLVGSLAALPLSWHVARRILPAGLGPPLALGLVATGLPFIFHGAQVKPYATDVAVTLLLLALALDVRQSDRGRGALLRLGLVGAIAPWLSYPAMLVDAGLLAALALAAVREGDRGRLRALAPVALAWAAGIAGAIVWARGTVTPEDIVYMRQFWAADFAPMPPRELRDLGWPVARLSTVYGGGGLRYPAPGLLLALAVLGTAHLWRRHLDRAWLLLGPIAATFGAAALHVFPFEPRVVLFLFPAFLMLTAAGPEALGALVGARRRLVTAVAALACGGLALVGLVRNPPPHAPEPLKPVLRAMRQAWQPGDRAYVYYGGEKAFVYYARRQGFAAGDYILGRCAREDPRVYLRELDALRGAPRVWLVVTHAVPEELRALQSYLERIGTHRASFEAGGGPGTRRRDRARADLYDLSDAGRQGTATAETFPLPPAAQRGSRAAWSCHPAAGPPEDVDPA